MKNPWIVILAVVVVLIGGSVWYSAQAGSRNNEGIKFTPNVKGNPEAAVSLVEYSDMQCPACAAFQPYVDEVVEAFGDKLKFEYKHFPLPMHAVAEPAARAAEAAGQQGKFFEYTGKLFSEQGKWSISPNPMGLFYTYAEELGLDVDTFKRHLNASLIREKVRAESQEGKDLGVSGTPSFFLNGERMVIQTYEEFRAQIEAAVNPQVNFSLDGTPVEEEVNEPEVEFAIPEAETIN